MADLRPPPAFQVYASDDLANERYYVLRQDERGLLDGMRRACWVSSDGSVPLDVDALATRVRSSATEVRASLTAAVLAWFHVSPDGARAIDPELERQRARALHRRQAQSEGSEQGRKAISARRKQRAAATDPVTGPVTGPESGPLLNRTELNRTPSIGRADIQDPFVDEIKQAEGSETGLKPRRMLVVGGNS